MKILLILVVTLTAHSQAWMPTSDIGTANAQQPTDDLLHVLAQIAERTGARICADHTVRSEPVSPPAAGLPISAALEAVVAQTPYVVKWIGDHYLVYRPISAGFHDADLREALSDVGAAANVSLAIAPQIEGQVSITLSDVPFEKAIRLLLTGRPYVATQTAGCWLIAAPAGERNEATLRPKQDGMGSLTSFRDVRTLSTRQRSPEVTASFEDAELGAVLLEISKQTGVQVCVDPSVRLNTVTGARLMTLRGAPVGAAVRSALNGTGYTARKVNDRYLVYRPVSNTFLGDQLEYSLLDVSLSSDMRIIVGPEVKGSAWAAYLDLPVETVVRTLLAGTPYVLSQTPDYWLITTPFSRDTDPSSARDRAGAAPFSSFRPVSEMIQSRPTPNVTAALNATELGAALVEVSKKTGVGILTDMTVDVHARITTNLADAPIDEALSQILGGTGYTFRWRDGRYLVYRPITNVFMGDNRRPALCDLALSAGLAIAVGPHVNGSVFADLSEEPFELAVEVLLAGTSYVARFTPEYTTVTAPADERVGREARAGRRSGIRLTTFHAPTETAQGPSHLTVSATFDGIDLRGVLAEMSKMTGVPIYADPTVKEAKAVHIELGSRPIEAALESILAGTPYTFGWRNDRYLVYRPIASRFIEGDLPVALADVASAAGVPIIADEVEGRVLVMFENVPVEDALEMLLVGTPYVAREGMEHFLVTERDGRAEGASPR